MYIFEIGSIHGICCIKEGRHIFVFACNYLAHTESPVYLSFPGVVDLGHLRISAGEESSLESVAALHDFAKMVRFSDFLYFLKIDQNRPIFAKLVLGHQKRYSGSVFSYDQGTIHSFQKSWCRIISIWNFRLQCKKNTVLRRTKIISTHLWEIVQMTLESLKFHQTPLFWKEHLMQSLKQGKPKILLHVLERQIPSRGGYRFRALKCMKSAWKLNFHLNSRGFGSVPFVCVQHVFR